MGSVDQSFNPDDLRKKPAESAALELHDQLDKAASAAIWDPLWPEPHHRDRNVVMGLALNYGHMHFHWYDSNMT